MRCKSAIKQIGPFIDGELSVPEAQALSEHLEVCEDCARRYVLMSGLVKELSSLPAIVPTPEESYRLWNRLRREMAAPATPRPVSRRGQLAAAAMSALVLATVAGVSLAVWSGGGPAPVMEEASTEGEAAAETGKEPGQLTESIAADTMTGTGLAAAALASPALVTTNNEYTAADLEDFRNDLGTRLDFYSTYWYPSSGSISKPATLKRMQADLTEDLTQKAAAAGQNPGELELAVAAVLEQAGGEPVLPCYAERAKVDGKDAWLISVSGPEDYLLFPDRQKPPAMVLASLGGEESLKVSESALRELAALLAPSSNGNVPLVPAGTLQSEETWSGAPDEQTTSTPGETRGETPAETGQDQVQEDFQAFLRQLAAQGTSLDTISALEDLDYEQVLMLMQGDWGSLAAGGVNLSDFLTPPQRLWAVDCASGQVLWSAE